MYRLPGTGDSNMF